MARPNDSRRPQPVPASRYRLPDPQTGIGEHGALGVGGDFAPGTLIAAYKRGIFPWPAPEVGVVLWCSPDPRMVLPLADEPHWSRSLRRAIRKKPFRVTVDQAFDAVIAACADRSEGTWILPELSNSFSHLHQLGWAHSLEVWNTETGALAGGIYGLALGAAFTAESMFHRETDASKVAFAALAERLRSHGFRIFDAEMPTHHLASLGCVPIRRSEFLRDLAEAVEVDVDFSHP